MLSHEAINELQTLYKKEYGIDISLEEAFLRAEALINLYKSVCIDDDVGKVDTPDQKLPEKNNN